MINKFIEKSKKRHGDKYDYTKVVYINSITKVEIICNMHGSFFVRPDAHVRKVGCPKCNGGIRYNTESFIDKCIKLYGDKYKYDKVNYINSNTKVTINCPKHGHFNIRPANFLIGQECSKCSGVYRKNTLDFINESTMMHNGFYNYDNCNYKNNRTKVKINCPIHGVFEQTPKDHLNGSGCNMCKSSKGEKEIIKLLEIIGIKYETNKIFKSCKGINGGTLPFDFYINDINLLIEYDGRQHHEPVSAFGGIDSYTNQILNDEIRNNWCSDNNIRLIRISYKDKDYKRTLISLFSDIYKYDLKKYIDSYYDLFNYLCSLNKNIITNYKDGDINCDFLIKDINLAIRLIGFWKNSDINQSRNENIRLKKEFNKIGINLINIFEDVWNNKKEIIKYRLKYMVNNSIKIMARKCIIKKIDIKTCRNFLEQNHTQGFVGSKFKYGLYHNDNLVSVMTFGELRKNMGSERKENSYELIRFCNLLGYSVVGSASKILNYFIKTEKPNLIISYADLSWTKLDNSVYKKIGLFKSHISKPSYYYIENNIKHNRFLYRKDVLVKRGYDPNKTEFEICNSIGLLRVYDTGTIKYIWTLGNIIV